ncbi:MAG: VOC family protein [Myxococcales bacterium]|nr:VOC family protein [Myxococcales bacterium]
MATPKNPEKLFPMFLTDKLEETKAFYRDKLDFEVVFDLDSYLQVRYGQGEGAPELCFMRPDAYPDGVTRPAYGGQGVIVSVPTESADEASARIRAAGAEVQGEPTDKPWGWRSFFVTDPNGVTLDFFHVYNDNPMGGEASA